MKKKVSREIIFIAAMCINSIAITLLVKSEFGISTLSSLPLVLSKIFPQISFGMTNFLVQTILLGIVILITKQPKIAYIFSFLVGFIFGVMVDGVNILIQFFSDDFLFRLLYFIVGWLMICGGAALFIESGMPLMPFDCAVKDLSVYLNRKVKFVKTVCDVLFVGTAVILSVVYLNSIVGVGVGTVLMMLWNGSLTQKYLDWFRDIFLFECCTKLGIQLNKLTSIKVKK